uniref:Uncharacterized protein n=1 Tax=Arundo donax TaxID=35708 RepID=A0A0A9BUA6_ARUDO
MAVSMALLQDS